MDLWILPQDRPEGENIALAQGIICIMEVKFHGILSLSWKYWDFAEFCGEFRKIYEISNFSVKSTSGRKLHPEIPIIPFATTTFPAGGDFL